MSGTRKEEFLEELSITQNSPGNHRDASELRGGPLGCAELDHRKRVLAILAWGLPACLARDTILEAFLNNCRVSRDDIS